MEFKVDQTYKTKMSDGALFTLDSVFCVVSRGVENYTLYGKYVGYEHLSSCRMSAERLLKQVSWQEYFNYFVDIKCTHLRWKVEKQLRALEEKYII